MTELSDYLRDVAISQDLSTYKVEEIAKRKGHSLSQSTVSRYFKGEYKKPNPEYLRAFSAVLGVPLSRLESLAGMPRSRSPFKLPPEADRLDDQERKVILSMVELLASRKAPTPTGGPEDYGLVAKTDDGQRIDPDLL